MLVQVVPGGAGGAIHGSSAAATNYPVEANNGDLYLFFVDSNLDVVYIKSTDRGLNWGSPVVVFAGSTTQLALWFDRWSGIAAGLIHCAYTESVNDDTLYRSVNTESADALSTETTIFAGGSTASGSALSITRARGGNLYCKTMIDAGAEGGFYRSTDVGATWGARTDSEALATTDQWALVPGFAADNQDIMCIFLDQSASEISRVIYDNSGDTWAETSIATGITALAATTAWPNWSVAVDLTNSQILLGVWTAADLLNADLLFFTITESAITAKTNVITDSTDDQGLCGIGIDTDTQDWYVFYVGRTGGGDTFSTTVFLCYQVSTDDGATWGGEVRATASPASTAYLAVLPRFSGDALVMYRSAVGANQLAMAFDYTPAVGGGGAPGHGNMSGGMQ